MPAYMLAHFTHNTDRHGPLLAVDVRRRIKRSSTPRKEGFRNDFYRIDAPAARPTAIEDLMANEFDSKVAPVLDTLACARELPSDDIGLGTVLSLLGVLAARVPKMRAMAEGHWNELLNFAEEQLASQSYEVFRQAAEKAGIDPSREAYEEYLLDRQQLDADGGRWVMDATTLVMNELKLASELTDVFWKRSWTLLIAEGAEFVCTDAPVARFGGVNLLAESTRVYAPLTRGLAVLGHLPRDGSGGRVTAPVRVPTDDVAALNREALEQMHEMFWASDDNYCVMGSKGTILRGTEELFAELPAVSR